MNVKDNVCFVTGGASGIGLALCTRFARGGGHVVLSDLNQEACERQAMRIGALPVAAAELAAVAATREGRPNWRPWLPRWRTASCSSVASARGCASASAGGHVSALAECTQRWPLGRDQENGGS